MPHRKNSGLSDGLIADRIFEVITHELLNTLQHIHMLAKEGQRRNTHASLAEIDDLALKGQHLLRQGRGIGRGPQLRFRRHSLRSIRDLLKNAAQERSDRRIEIDDTTENLDSIVIETDLDLLSCAVRAILDNAIQHGVPVAPVKINLRLEEEKILIIAFRNRVATLEADFNQWLEPGWTTSTNQMGIGLTLCAQLLGRLNGHITGHCSESFVLVELRLPLTTEPSKE